MTTMSSRPAGGGHADGGLRELCGEEWSAAPGPQHGGENRQQHLRQGLQPAHTELRREPQPGQSTSIIPCLY